MLDDSRSRLEPRRQSSRVAHRTNEICDHTPVGAERCVAAVDLPQPRQGRFNPECKKLERDRRPQSLYGLRRVNDHDELPGCDRNELLPGQCRPGTLHEPGFRTYLVGSVYRHVEPVQSERFDFQTELPRRLFSLRRGRYASQIKVPGSECRKEVMNGRTRTEADAHPRLHQ